MNYNLNECIILMLTISNQRTSKAEITNSDVITRLSFHDEADTICEESARAQVHTSSGESFFMVHFRGVEYKVRQQMSCEDGKNELLVQNVNTIEIEKCHSKN